MATTNFQQWNNAAINQESDAQYAVDSLRTGGAPVDGELPSPTFNKFAYQGSTFYTAFCEMMANKGFSTSDADINVLSAVLANILTSADIANPLVFVPYSPTPILNATKVAGFYIQLNGNMTLPTITGLAQGQLLAICYLSNGTGTVTFPTQMFNATAPPLTNSFSMQLFIYDGIGGAFLRPVGPLINDTGLFISNNGNFGGNVSVGGNITAGGTVTAVEADVTEVHASGVTAFTIAASTSLTAAAATISGNLNAGSLQIAGTAPTGQVLTGNGTTYVPQNLPVKTVTRNDVTGARAFSTTYTNTSGGFMYVTGYGTTTGSDVGSVQCVVNGDADFSNTVGATVTDGACGFSFAVPPGATYGIVANTLTGGRNAVNGIGKWIETIVSL